MMPFNHVYIQFACEVCMDAQLIRDFMVVAKNLSFTRAAHELGTSQPLLSRAVRRLEDLVGEELIDRTRRQIGLTPAGCAFLKESQSILDRVDLAVASARNAGHGANRVLRIGVTEAVPAKLLRHGFNAFVTQRPEVSLTVKMIPGDVLTDALRSGELDAGLILFNNADRRDLTWRTVAQSRLVLAVPSAWNFPKDQEVHLDSLRDAPFVLSDPVTSPQVYATQISWCDEAGFRPQNVRYASTSLESRFLVACGLGVGFAYESSLGPSRDGIDFLPIVNYLQNDVLEFHLTWLADRPSRLTQEFLRCLIENVPQTQIISCEHGFELDWKQATPGT